MSVRQDDFDHLDATGRAVAALSGHARWLVFGAVALVVLIAWWLIAAMAVRQADVRPPGGGQAGDTLLRDFPALPLPEFLQGFVSLCLTPVSLEPGLSTFVAMVLMWFLMSLAMMLPSALPMLRTYCEVADTGRAKQVAVVHPLVLLAGYLSVWLVASVGFAALTTVLGGWTATQGLTAAGALGVAGLYQFSGLKDACLKKCRNPFSTLFGRWSDRPAKIFRLGVEQGVWCLGCCWALMLVMLAVGVMNVFWMALLAVFALVEKQIPGRAATVAAGVILLVWSAALLVRSL